VERVYSLKQLGLPSPAYAYNWMAGSGTAEPVEQVSVTLPPHGGTLIFLSPERLTELPAHLP
jgi:hypothetical protein